MKLEQLYNLDYDSLKDFLLRDKETAKKVLKDIHIKNKLINPSNRYEFTWFAQEHSNDLLPYLLDEEGIKILNDSDSFESKINGLLTSCNPSLPELFKNKQFNELIINNIKKIMFYLKGIQPESALNLVDYIYKENNISLLNKIVLYFSSSTTLEVIKQFESKLEFKTKLQLIKNHKNVAEYLLNKDPTITTLSVFQLADLFNIIQNDIQLLPVVLKEKDFINLITTTPHIKEYRFIIDYLSKSNDISHIEEKRKTYYEKQMSNYLKEEGMLKDHYECYNHLLSINLEDGDTYQKIKENLVTYLNMDSSTKECIELTNKIFNLLYERDNHSLKKFFQNESNIQLSNIIIDYHFEEISYNLFINLKQLLKFQETDGKTLDMKDIEIYTKILNLDILSYDEKLELHKTLKDINFVEKYYDDIRNAKNKVVELIKQKMLTKENIQKYKNEDLSKKYDVDIFILEKDPFYILIKSLTISKTNLLEPHNICYLVDGASYSLDSSSKLNTFIDPKINYNLAYTNFETNQVVHIYPTDSYSFYARDNSRTATQRIFEFHTPESLCDEYEQYCEIVIAQKNEKKNNELNNNLKNPEMFAIYCYDVIDANDIISARKLGLGIILVKTKNYKNNSNISKKNMYDTLFLTDGYKNEINYLDQFNQDDKYNRRK